MTYSAPNPSLMHSVMLGSYSIEGQGRQIYAAASAPPSSSTYIAANRAFYYPFRIWRPVTVYRHWWLNGTTAGTNNIQVGTYDSSFNAITLGTSTLASGVSSVQFDDVTDYVLGPGLYYVAIWCNGTTTHVMRLSSAAVLPGGAYLESSLAGGLPNTATPASAGQTVLTYVCGLSLRSAP